MASKTIILNPINPPQTSEPTDSERLNFQIHFAAWRLHLWMKNIGTYEQIERKAAKGKLTVGVCPDANCDCSYKKL